MSGLWSIRNVVTAARYTARRLVARPAPIADRCIDGGPVHPRLHCPHRTAPGVLLCDRHGPWTGWPSDD